MAAPSLADVPSPELFCHGAAAAVLLARPSCQFPRHFPLVFPGQASAAQICNRFLPQSPTLQLSRSPWCSLTY